MNAVEIKDPLPEKRKVVSEEEWLKARKAHLTNEKELTRRRDELSRERQALPWVKVDKNYVFDGPAGKTPLSDLFGGRSQLIVYHFMLGPGWAEGCPSCSFLADHIDGALPHLNARDVTLAVVSRAPLAQIEAFKKRMGWRFPWVSSFDSDFNYDYHVSFTEEEMAKGAVYYNYKMQEFGSEEAPGISVFYKDKNGEVFHTYSAYGRGGDILLGAYNYLDMAPKGRDEGGLHFTMAWVRHHDKYGDSARPQPVKIDKTPSVSLETPRFENARAMFIAGQEQSYTCDNLSGIPSQWTSFGGRIGHIPGQVGNVAYGAVLGNGGNQIRYLTGVEVNNTSELPEDFSGIRIPAQRFAVFPHRGHVSTLRFTIDAIWNKWAPESGQRIGDFPGFLERYGEHFNPQTGLGDIEIWIPVKA